MEGVAAVTRAAAPRVLALVLPLVLALVAGCASHETPSPTAAEPRTRLAAAATSGSAEVGSFLAEPGDLWVGGRCSGGNLEVRVDPVAVLPIPCQELPGEQFLNQIVMTRSTTVTVSVTAPATVTWDLQVQQG